MNVQLDKGAIMPTRAHDTDAGIDFYTPYSFSIFPHSFHFIDTKVHIEVPHGTFGSIRSKSGLNRYDGITADGVIDEGYTGTVGITLHNDSDEMVEFTRGDKIAQVVITPVEYVSLEQVDKISGGERGDDGYGSTGR